MSPAGNWTDDELAEDQKIYRSLKARGLTDGDHDLLFKEHRTPYAEYRRFLRLLDKAYPPRRDSRRNHRARLPRQNGPFTPRPEAPDDHGSAGKDEGTNGPAMHKLSEEQR